MRKWHFAFVLLSLMVLALSCSQESGKNDDKAQDNTMAQNQNLTPDQQFLVDNREKEGVIETASGLQYKVLTEVAGPKPSATDQVTVHYRGTLIDGTEFDSSYSRGTPATFPLNRVISGWTEGLQLMSVGSKYEFYIPSDLGYGDRGAGAQIGPGATLIFQVELLKIN